mmetsp:Transcript_36717/g.71198  ORF Transcript_36717/g.71198 Transcript_36717/m.71198 type:complete len:311 (+) Transcript_36717:626-1558(+)
MEWLQHPDGPRDEHVSPVDHPCGLARHLETPSLRLVHNPLLHRCLGCSHALHGGDADCGGPSASGEPAEADCDRVRIVLHHHAPAGVGTGEGLLAVRGHDCRFGAGWESQWWTELQPVHVHCQRRRSPLYPHDTQHYHRGNIHDSADLDGSPGTVGQVGLYRHSALHRTGVLAPYGLWHGAQTLRTETRRRPHAADTRGGGGRYLPLGGVCSRTVGDGNHGRRPAAPAPLHAHPRCRSDSGLLGDEDLQRGRDHLENGRHRDVDEVLSPGIPFGQAPLPRLRCQGAAGRERGVGCLDGSVDRGRVESYAT